VRWEIKSILRRLRRDQKGAVAIFAAVSMIMLLGFAAISVDIANLMYVKSNLQASANVAAVAGGQNIPSGTAAAMSISYGAQTGQKNFFSPQTVTTTSTLKCLTTLQNLYGQGNGIPCLTYGNQAAANAIVVTQTAVVPTFFAGVFGINSVTVTASATASSKGGSTPPLNIMIILDTTQSMNTADPNCSVPGLSSATRLQCADYGVQVLLKELSPSVDKVSLMVFPGLKVGYAPLEYDCSSSTPSSSDIASYTTAANAVYQIISPPSTDYKISASSTSLNSSSNLVKAVSIPGVAGSSCSGVSALGGYGTYYATMLTAAQSTLAASQQAGEQNVIIFVSDGDSNALATNVGTGKSVPPNSQNPTAVNQCHQAITAAQAATAAGTWVYSIAYGASTSSSSSCSTDTPAISACSTMQQIASVSPKFYSDAPSSCVSVNTISALSSIFQNVGLSLLNSRLIPNGTT
jgi:Flp pilus assembly protein TadG